MRLAASARRSVHTVKVTGGYGNKSSGSSRVPKVIPTQKAAIAAVRKTAINQKAEHVIHNTKGVIRSANSYGNDPRSSKG